MTGPALRDLRVYATATDARVRPTPLPGGKADAVHYGLRHARGAVVGWVDADFGAEASTGDLRRAVMAIEAGDADCVAAHRDQPDWPLPRKAKTNTFAVAVRLLFRLPVRDTQAPLKMMTAHAAHTAARLAPFHGWAFDVAVLWALTRHRPPRPTPAGPLDRTRRRDTLGIRHARPPPRPGHAPRPAAHPHPNLGPPPTHPSPLTNTCGLVTHALRRRAARRSR